MDSSWFRRQPTLLPGRPLHAGRLYLVRSTASGFFMMTAFALYALYIVRDAELTPYQIIVQAMVLELTVVAFEIPTGVLADAVSRRLSIIIGTVVAGAGWAVIGLFPSFEGVLAGAGLGLADAAAPWVAGGVGQVALGVFFLFTMTEAGWRPGHTGGASRVTSMGRIAAAGLSEARDSRVVRAAFGTRFLFGASSEIFANLWGYHLLVVVGLGSGIDEVLLFGAMMLAGEGGALAIIAFGRRMSADSAPASAARVLSRLYLAWVLVVLALALSPTAALAIPLVVAGRAAMAAEQPFFLMWVNRGLDPRTRATVLSSLGQADSFGQVAQGPVSAAIIGLAGVRGALGAGALFAVPAVALARTRSVAAPEPRSEVAAGNADLE